jgi:hypothetical protein
MAGHESQNSKMNNNNYLLLYFIIVYACFLFKMPIWREILFLGRIDDNYRKRR